MMLKIKTHTLIKHKWVLLLAFLIFMALSGSTIKYVIVKEGTLPTFFETILIQINDKQLVLFPLMYALLLFTNQKPIHGYKVSNKLLINAFLAGGQYLVLFLLANMLYCIMVLDTNSLFYNYWSYIGGFYYTGLKPIVATAISLSLFYLRSCFLLFLISSINALTRKSHWGFWSAFLISYIDFILYDFLAMSKPLNILPFEHTEIINSDILIPDVYFRMDHLYYVSFLYWLGLFAFVYIVFLFNLKKRSSHENTIFK